MCKQRYNKFFDCVVLCFVAKVANILLCFISFYWHLTISWT